MTEREIFQSILSHKKPPRFPRDAIQLSFTPGEHTFEPDGGYDWFGVYWVKQADGTQTEKPGFRRIESMEDWQEAMPKCVNEEEMRLWGEKTQQGYDRVNKIQVVGLWSGHFERMQSLVGFEDALTAFYEYPDEVMEYMEAMTDFKIEEMRLIKKYYNPDIISPHDDWGMNTNMFIAPDMWRKFIKPQIKKMVSAAQELGMIYEQHSCGYITQIVGDLVECGVSMLEIQAVNDLKYIKENYGDRVVLRGCFNGQKLGAPDMTPEKARAEVRNTLNIVAMDGGFIAQRIWGTKPEVMAAIFDEYERFSDENYK